jgi:hypothetical protein
VDAVAAAMKESKTFKIIRLAFSISSLYYYYYCYYTPFHLTKNDAQQVGIGPEPLGGRIKRWPCTIQGSLESEG